ncbi:zinc finger protein 235-like [Belonocnema kinseyi]|uniref:zinc finger protein 235-like n=1 Tax=Belonocnema kinseyi TaxID=2817044 RepID=UPI00143DE4E4|nr:zinc finger protein 235-like [Belonocnema kinseyi]
MPPSSGHRNTSFKKLGLKVFKTVSFDSRLANWVCSWTEETTITMLSPKAKDDSWNGVMIKSEPPEYSVDEKHLKEEKSNLTNFAIKVKSDLSKNEGDTIKLPAVDMSERYWCSKCQKQLETAESLRIHTEEHDRTEKSDPDPTGSITKPYTCPTCKKVFKKFATVKAHMLKHKPLNLKCKFCQKVFSTQRNIKEHMEIHEKKKYYACDICNKNFIVKSNLKNHLRRHMNEKNFTCNVCKKKFVWKYELELHKVTHTGKKPFQCDDCKKGFSFRSSMKVHILRNMKNGGHNGRVRKNPVNHICDICCESFPLMSALDTHKLIHSDKKPYECEICKRCFVDKYKLRYHQIRRSEEDPYFECEICKLKFCHKRTFLMHEAIHYKFDSQPIPLIKEEIDLQANESEPSIVSLGVIKDEPARPKFVTVHFSSNKKKKHRRRFDQGFSKSSTDEPDCFPGLMLDEKDPLKLDEDIQIKQEQAMNETN